MISIRFSPAQASLLNRHGLGERIDVDFSRTVMLERGDLRVMLEALPPINYTSHFWVTNRAIRRKIAAALEGK